ncbi:MAG: DUF4918 family protein [Bacteroidetes bacterium]|jgi:uracil-DNA glycosylase|nr:DUF4918 family protein [Bacteroidota bacterium]
MSFGQRVLDFNQSLQPDWKLPPKVELLYPFGQADTWRAMEQFYHRYYADERPRIAILGINPGRFGAGVTGVPFTDPVRLESECGIANDFKKKPELSSDFVYRFIHAWGDVPSFYNTFYITSICPLGFTKDGKNYNYYDDKKLERAVEPHIIDNLRAQIKLGVTPKIALCMGVGKNWKYLQQLNAKHEFFEEIKVLPHPRWVMQYRRKRLQEFLQQYVDTLNEAQGQA